MDHERVKSVFSEALDLPPDSRDSFLDHACASDPAMRTRVRSLLDAALREDSFLGGATLPTADPSPAPGELAPGHALGPYTIRARLGEGGFGTVYEARQDAPLNRAVALKILKPGMDSRSVVARFEHERQALAMMDHPGIARVYDAGTAPNSRPYFAMELVRGEPITRYADHHQLDVRARLELMAQVCDAVQHAHQRGIVHRDLKPSNVLVGEVDGQPSPKVIDFGIAKALADPRDSSATQLDVPVLLGTPDYMSPEQARAGANADTRSDVYSLGALLYHLLVGAPPLATSIQDPLELRRRVLEAQPQRPSQRVRQDEEPFALVSQARSTTRPALARALAGDLDRVVLKCLEKDPDRRYQSARELAQDLRRYLAGFPVLASSPGPAYRAMKFLARHRAASVAGLAVVVAIGAWLASLLWRGQVARRERDNLARVASFMSDTLGAVDPSISQGRDTRLLRDLMDQAARRLESGELDALPGAHADLCLTLASVYHAVAQPDRADAMLARAGELFEGEPSIATPSRRSRWRGIRADVHAARAQIEPALREMDLALGELGGVGAPRERAALLGSKGKILLEAGQLGESERTLREAIAASADPQSPDPDIVNNLAAAIKAQGRYADALPLYQQALAGFRSLHASDHPGTADCLQNLAADLSALERAEEAIPLGREALAMLERLYPDGHPALALAYNNLAGYLYAAKQLDELPELLDKSLAMSRRFSPPGGDSALSNLLANIAVRHFDLRQYPQAEAKLVEAIEINRRIFPGDHPNISNQLQKLAYTSAAMGRPADAERQFREAIAMYERLHPGDAPQMMPALVGLGQVLRDQGRYAEAADFMRRAVVQQRRVSSEPGTDLASTLAALGTVLEMAQAPDAAREARAYLAESLEIRTRIQPEHWTTAYSSSTLGGAILTIASLDQALTSDERLALLREAEPLLREGYERLVERREQIAPRVAPRRLADAASRLARLYQAWNELAPSQELASQAARWNSAAADHLAQPPAP